MRMKLFIINIIHKIIKLLPINITFFFFSSTCVIKKINILFQFKKFNYVLYKINKIRD